MKNKKRLFLAGIWIALAVLVLLLSVMCKNNKSIIDIKVPDYYSLSEFYFDGDFNEFYRDSYDWYQSIEDKEGVYIVNTSFYDYEVLNGWKENKVYHSVPDKAFWYFTVSPSYLKQMGIEISAKEISDAQNGTRLYLIPDTLSENESEIMISFLKEDAIEKADTSNIQTVFTVKQDVRIIKYTPNKAYFTWPCDRGQAVTDKAPVIYVCTSENMKYFENESLISTGLDSYVKFADGDIVRKYTENSIMKKYNTKFTASSAIYIHAAKSKLTDKGIEKVFK